MGLAQERENKQPSFDLMSIRHTSEVKAKIEHISNIENCTFAVTARNLLNAGLKAKYGIEIVGNQIVDHGNTPELPDSSMSR
ncbi:hypothetical protein [Methylophaga sp.]|uniref:hypothetical protein n=1 Tax=Methylophaga sp. TaxID=2024840 RepID=UPI0025E545ED|nr:hypothetical protein [Methylophaga sp.]